MKKDEAPNKIDWMNVSNDLIKILNDLRRFTGEPLLPKARPGIPSEADLQAWEDAFPGSAQKFKDAAKQEMEHRLLMEKMNR